jgi:arylsulfatase A-like enzyme
MRGPGIEPNTSCQNVVTNIDIAPTILEMAGLPESSFKGLSLNCFYSKVYTYTLGGYTQLKYLERQEHIGKLESEISNL